MRNLAQAVPSAPMTVALSLVPKARVVTSIRAIGEAAWNACYAGEIEDYGYLLAIEEAGIAGFSWRYAVVEAEGQLLAAMPAFLTDYRLDTTLDPGRVRDAIRAVRRVLPRFLTLKLACLGSPETECGRIGFHPSVAAADRPAVAASLLAAFEAMAAAEGASLLGVKDVPDDQRELWDATAPHYSPLPGMAGSTLDIDFTSIDAYLARLSKESRKDMRRKLKAAADVRVEYHTDVVAELPRIFELYRATKNRSDFQFEELTGAYFTGVLRHMPGRAVMAMYYAGDRLIAANLLLKDEASLLDKFFCSGDEARAYNLYFVSWFENLRYCLAHGYRTYRSGQASYANKRRLKSRFEPNTMYFRHRRRTINALLKRIAPLLAMGDES